MHETKNHGFHEIQEKIWHNSLTGEFAHWLAEGRKKNKTHADICEITEKHQHQVITNQKTI